MKSNLKNLLEKFGTSQMQISKKLNLNRSYINKLANGKAKTISVSSLESLSKELGNCDIKELIDFDYEK